MLAALTTGRNMSEQRLQQKYAANSQSSHNWHYSSDGRYADIYWHTPVMDALTTGSHWECTSISSPHCTTPIIALVPCLLVLEFVFIYWYLFMVFTPTMVVLTTGMSISGPDCTIDPLSSSSVRIPFKFLNRKFKCLVTINSIALHCL